jgi:hypothetical protein
LWSTRRFLADVLLGLRVASAGLMCCAHLGVAILAARDDAMFEDLAGERKS